MKKTLYLLLCLLSVVSFSSCGSNDDNPLNFSHSGELFATVESYTSSSVVFFLYYPGQSLPLEFECDLSSKITKEEYPIGSQVLISYKTNGIHPLYGVIVRIELNAITKVKSIGLTEAKSDQCNLDYAPISIGSNCYMSGNTVNFVANVQQAASRSWKAYLNTETSSQEVAHVYIVTEAAEPKEERVSEAVSINVGTLISKHKHIFLHFRSDDKADNVRALTIPAQEY